MGMGGTWPDHYVLSRAEEALIRNDATELSDALCALCPQDPDAGRIEALVGFALADGPTPAARSPVSRLFFQNIHKTKALLRGGGSPSLHRRYHMTAGVDFDRIAEVAIVDEWTIAKSLNYLLMNRLRPERRAAVVATMRDDGIYILEFVAWYLAMGFEHLFIYTNDNADGSELLLRRLAEHKIITLIESKTSGAVWPTMKAYEHSVHFLHELREFVWVFFADSDEYLYVPPHYDYSVINLLAALQERYPEQLPSGICFHWLWFVSDMVYERRPGLLIERFQHARPHHLTKVLVRLHDLLSMRGLHWPYVRAGGFVVDSAFARQPLHLLATRIAGDKDHPPIGPQYEGGRINHYWTRSFEEFAVKNARARSLKLDENVYQRPFELFFKWNGHDSVEDCYRTEDTLLHRVKMKMSELSTMEGIGPLVQQIDRNFPQFLDQHYHHGSLRGFYESAQTEASAL